MPDSASARVEMCNVDFPSGDFVRDVQLSPFAPAEPLSPAALAKFSEKPHQEVFDTGFAQVCYVNWDLAGEPDP